MQKQCKNVTVNNYSFNYHQIKNVNFFFFLKKIKLKKMYSAIALLINKKRYEVFMIASIMKNLPFEEITLRN